MQTINPRFGYRLTYKVPTLVLIYLMTKYDMMICERPV